MKFVMDERIKHRLTGVVVIVSMAVIFLPAMMKKSTLHFEENVSASLKLPAKPIQPKVVIPKQMTLLKSVKVAHVDIPPIAETPHPSTIAKAESLSNPGSVLVKVDALPLKSLIATVVMPQIHHEQVKPITTAKVENKKGYGIQLASFTQQKNAEILVARLRKQGYVATYNIFNGKQGQFYQVVAGMLNKKDEAIHLQKQLATNMQLKGYIIQTGVS